VIFIWSGERRGGVARVNAGVNGFNAIEDGGGGGLRGELRGENDGGVVTARWHPRRGVGRRGVAGRRWRHDRACAAGGEGRS
jgi:hypothetical protein